MSHVVDDGPSPPIIQEEFPAPKPPERCRRSSLPVRRLASLDEISLESNKSGGRNVKATRKLSLFRRQQTIDVITAADMGRVVSKNLDFNVFIVYFVT